MILSLSKSDITKDSPMEPPFCLLTIGSLKEETLLSFFWAWFYYAPGREYTSSYMALVELMSFFKVGFYQFKGLVHRAKSREILISYSNFYLRFTFSGF